MTAVCENVSVNADVMTAAEMCDRHEFVEITVSFGFKPTHRYGGGHVTVEGRTRYVAGECGDCVWVGPVCLPAVTNVLRDRRKPHTFYVHPHYNTGS